MDIDKATRFKDADWFQFPGEEEYVLIGGAGGIGSWLTLLLSRAGFKPIIYDFDTIEEHNIGGQLFKTSDIDKSKVGAVKDIVREFTGETIIANNDTITDKTMSHYYVFSAFDNMKARKDLFESWVKGVEKWKLDNTVCPKPVFIDGRLTFEQLQIFCVTPNKIEEYRKHLFDDSEIEEAPCTLKQTSHSAAMIGAHMTGFFTNHIANVLTKSEDRNIPFFWQYFIPLDYNISQ